MYDINFHNQLLASLHSAKRERVVWTWKSLQNTRFLYKQHFYKQFQVKIGKKN